jgi:type IV secretory pathway TraG/TraD family ATPase VirD4
MPELHKNEPLLVIGETDFRGMHHRWGLHRADRLRHLYLLGKTGSGKSTLIANLVRQDLVRGEGLALIDPHGDLVDAVLSFVPAHRTNAVLLFAPEDREFPIAFNVFRVGRRAHPDTALLVAELLSVFRKQWSEFWGPRLEHLLRAALLAVAPNPRATLLFLYQFLTDERLRERVVAEVQDPVVKQVWTKEVPSYSAALRAEALSPILNKLGALVGNPIIRNLVAQERSRVDFRALLDERGILLAKLPVGAIGEDAAHLLGSLLVSGIQLAAMERRCGSPTFWLFADEFQHFTSGSIATLLSESRKFGLGLVLAHQYLGQLPEAIKDAVLGNVGTMLVFRVGAEDAKALEAEFGPELAASDLERLAQYRLAARVLAKGESLRPFTARTLPPPPLPPDAAARVSRIIEQSRSRHAAPRAEVERMIRRAFSKENEDAVQGGP